MKAPAERRLRLFFALWPSAAMQAQLATAAGATLLALRSGRPVPCEHLHLTLAFLGSVPESALQRLANVAANRAPAPVAPQGAIESAIEVAFDRLEYWPRAEIVCAGASVVPRAAQAFAEALKQSLTSAGFAPDLKPFRPHVTLARQVRHRPLAQTLTEVRWRFRDFALVESRSSPGGSLYSVRNSWALYSG